MFSVMNTNHEEHCRFVVVLIRDLLIMIAVTTRRDDNFDDEGKYKMIVRARPDSAYNSRRFKPSRAFSSGDEMENGGRATLSFVYFSQLQVHDSL